MIIVTVAVGEKYINLCKNEIEKFISLGYRVLILTDIPETFKYGETFKYDKKIFSFFDKLLFTGKIVEETSDNVLYIDADRLCEVNPKAISFLKKTDKFTIFDYWHIQIETDVWKPWIKFNDFHLDYFNPFISYCKINNIDTDKLFRMWEGIFLFPTNNQITRLLYDIEQIKPIFEYMSLTGSIANNIYYGKLGISEGLAMSYVLEKNNLQFNKLSLDNVFTPKLI